MNWFLLTEVIDSVSIAEKLIISFCSTDWLQENKQFTVEQFALIHSGQPSGGK